MQAPECGRIGILLDERVDKDRIIQLLMRSLGKRRDARASPTRDWTKAQASRWLEAHEIQDIYVGPIERLELDALNELIQVAGPRRLWLIYQGVCADREHLEKRKVRLSSVKHVKLLRDVDGKRGREEPLIAFDLPALPMVDETRFLGACQRDLDLLDFIRVSELVNTSAEKTYARLEESTSPEALVIDALDAQAPVWVSVAILRGVQLGAISRGFRLMLDLGAWIPIRGGLGAITLGKLAAMNSAIDPRPGALVSVFYSCGADFRRIRYLRLSDFSPRATSIRLGEGAVPVTEVLQPILRAYLATRAASHSGALVFGNSRGSMMNLAGLRNELRSSLHRFGLPAAISVAEGMGRSSHHNRSILETLNPILRPLEPA